MGSPVFPPQIPSVASEITLSPRFLGCHGAWALLQVWPENPQPGCPIGVFCVNVLKVGTSNTSGPKHLAQGISGGFTRNGTHRLKCLNMWSLACGTIRRHGLFRGSASLTGGIEVSEAEANSLPVAHRSWCRTHSYLSRTRSAYMPPCFLSWWWQGTKPLNCEPVPMKRFPL